MNKILIIISLVLFILLSTLYSIYNKTLKEKVRFESNQETLMASLKTYKFRDSLNVVENGKLTLNINELKNNRAKDLALIKELKLRPA